MLAVPYLCIFLCNLVCANQAESGKVSTGEPIEWSANTEAILDVTSRPGGILSFIYSQRKWLNMLTVQ